MTLDRSSRARSASVYPVRQAVTWSTSARVRPFFTYDGYKISLGKEGRK
ncbi:MULTISPECIES: hypothetical protein [Oscillospiraceae]|nr:MULTISPECIES: hypothetical protein [Oscillospiraceae]ERK63662.1 hypothetical protein HMPREF1545_00828 [Oscillibacter sp. KLE 1728]ERK64290.1 hypothetical protein HMPREF1546_01724 [Oscillibacter sp. KLE 1745]MCQ5042192.1 hypothetical protein [Dysosmobacter welbionis]MDR3948784.1 hypothetical protein [Dysosmobacter sp.]MDR3968501.1 hypothetical protein [Dysosmobacter sp.]